MSSTERRRFLSISDWYTFIADVQKGTVPADTDLGELRRAVYRDIEHIRQRPLFVYAVRFTDAQVMGPTSIDLGDVDGFTDLVQAVGDSAQAVDVLIHSPGGSP